MGLVLRKAIEAVRTALSKKSLKYCRQMKKGYLKKIWEWEGFDESVSRKVDSVVSCCVCEGRDRNITQSGCRAKHASGPALSLNETQATFRIAETSEQQATLPPFSGKGGEKY
jgi:hypothetical protein